jgi:threonine 3-dehydrogenase
MIHYAARGERYDCFVRPDTCLPFMVMPDAIRALIYLTEAPVTRLSIPSYNVTAFSISADRIRQYVQRELPGAEIYFVEDARRQEIIDSWPADVDDTAARRDWNWHPEYDENRAFVDYLIPAIKQRYGHSAGDI